MNNSQVPWFILVPKTNEIELFKLSKSEQEQLQQEINLISKFVVNNFSKVTKLNVAAIGNMVSQLHVHIVGRNPSDYCWPNVVWGSKPDGSYSAGDVLEIKNKISTYLGSAFKGEF